LAIDDILRDPPLGQVISSNSDDHYREHIDQLTRLLASGGFWLMYGFLKTDGDHGQTGLAETDLDRISSRLTLLSRRDGMDNGRSRPSAWFLYQKK